MHPKALKVKSYNSLLLQSIAVSQYIRDTFAVNN